MFAFVPVTLLHDGGCVKVSQLDQWWQRCEIHEISTSSASCNQDFFAGILILTEGNSPSIEPKSKATDLERPKFSDDSALASMTTAQREERRMKKRLATTTGSTFQGHNPSLIRFAMPTQFLHDTRDDFLFILIMKPQ